jgi:hypothetical protein
MSLKEGYARTDTDGLVYKVEDTFWAVWPDDEDPGVCDHKAGAVPVPESEYWEPDSYNQTDPHPNPYGNTATGHFYPHLGQPSDD